MSRSEASGIAPAAVLFTPDEAAALLRCSRDTIYREVRDGRLESLRLSSGKRSGIRIYAAALAERFPGLFDHEMLA